MFVETVTTAERPSPSPTDLPTTALDRLPAAGPATPAVDEDALALPLRGDTVLGACHAIGEDFGFHPNWLRVLFASGLLWNPVAVIGAYLGLAALVALSRLLFPRTPGARRR